jgi:Tfp pilus assembly protein PilN
MANWHYRNDWSIIINLASHPRRNRRFYRLMIFGLVAVLAAIIVNLVIFNLKNVSEFSRASLSNKQIWQKITELNSENRRISREVQNLNQQYKSIVDELNGLIEQKAFSWVKFFSCLEEALPSGCYLVSFNPSRSSSSLEFRIKLGLSNRDDLSSLLRNFQQQGFREIKILSEAFQDNKFQVEMSFKDVEIK